MPKIKESQTEIFINTVKSIISAQNDREILLVTLKYCIENLQADAVSFLPYDEWKLYYPLIQLDMNGMELRNEQEISEIEKKQACKNCLLKHGGEDCVLISKNENTYLSVKCYTFLCDEREIGIINLFFKEPPKKINNNKNFSRILSLAGEMLLSLQKKEIEIAASLNSRNGTNIVNDLPSSLKLLLEKLLIVFSFEFVFLFLPGGLTGNKDEFIYAEIQNTNPHVTNLVDALHSFGESGERIKLFSLEKHTGRVLKYKSTNDNDIFVVPINWDQESPAGLLFFGTEIGYEPAAQTHSYLETFSMQTALLLNISRNLSIVEFHSIVEERNRLAREIHDGLAQTLAFLKMQTFQMQNYLTQGDVEKLSNSLKLNYRTLSDAYTDARYAIDDLRIIPAKGMIDWINRVIKDYEIATDQIVNSDISYLADRLSIGIQSQIIRIIQEALSNIRKHSNADQVCIKGINTNNFFVFQIIDNGCGFIYNNYENNHRKNYGLRGMGERAERIGAILLVNSIPGEGTTIELKIPLAQIEAE